MQTEYSGHLWPEFLSFETNPNFAKMSLFIPMSLHWFNGHFPDNPVLPGVVQTHWAATLSHKLFFPDRDFERISNLKFKKPIIPGSSLSLELQASQEKILFSYLDDGQTLSSGIIFFGLDKHTQ